MLVTSDVLKMLTAGLRTDFMLAYQAADQVSTVPQIATVIQTTLPTQDYGWLTNAPKMREFVDERQVKALKGLEWSITDKTWEATLGVQRRAIEDDQYGAIRIRVNDLAAEPVRHKEEIVAVKYALGATVVGPDGQYLIDTDHAESGTNQSNKSTNALSEGELATAIAAMMAFTDDKGKALGIRPTHLLVGPKLMFTAKRILNSAITIATGLASTSSGSTAGNANVLQGMLELVVSPYLIGTYDDYWFVIDGSRAVKGVILQERSDVPIEFAALDDPNSTEAVFMRDEFFYGVRGRYEVGFGLWQTVFGGIL